MQYLLQITHNTHFTQWRNIDRQNIKIIVSITKAIALYSRINLFIDQQNASSQTKKKLGKVSGYGKWSYLFPICFQNVEILKILHSDMFLYEFMKLVQYNSTWNMLQPKEQPTNNSCDTTVHISSLCRL
jgi:hypothetical protein